jgi:hypothetical protein
VNLADIALEISWPAMPPNATTVREITALASRCHSRKKDLFFGSKLETLPPVHSQQRGDPRQQSQPNHHTAPLKRVALRRNEYENSSFPCPIKYVMPDVDCSFSTSTKGKNDN